MTVKKQLAEVIEELPEILTLEDAIDRIYRAMKLKQSLQAAGMRQEGRSPFAGWLGKAQGPGENATPRFTSDDDLWQ